MATGITTGLLMIADALGLKFTPACCRLLTFVFCFALAFDALFIIGWLSR